MTPLWRSQEYEYDDDGNMTYRGASTVWNADVSKIEWYIWKFSYTDSNMISVQGPIYGAWNNKEGLFS